MLFITSINPFEVVEETDLHKCKFLFEETHANALTKAIIFHSIPNFIVHAHTDDYVENDDYMYSNKIEVDADHSRCTERLQEFSEGYYIITYLASNSIETYLRFNKLEDSMYYNQIMPFVRKKEIDKILKQL